MKTKLIFNHPYLFKGDSTLEQRTVLEKIYGRSFINIKKSEASYLIELASAIRFLKNKNWKNLKDLINDTFFIDETKN